MSGLSFAIGAYIAAPAAHAQELPQSVSVSSSTLQHAISFIGAGGTRAEGDALAKQLLQEAQADIAKQQKFPEPTPAPVAPDADKKKAP